VVGGPTIVLASLFFGAVPGPGTLTFFLGFGHDRRRVPSRRLPLGLGRGAVKEAGAVGEECLEIFRRGVVPKDFRGADGTPLRRTPAPDISDALTHLREVGPIPWEHIDVETRSFDSLAYTRSVV
jgi:hypothetical protein